jgi:hypothetical protein
LTRRISRLLCERRPFVVTQTYVGPARGDRDRPGHGKSKIKTFEVPHPVRLRQEGASPIELRMWLLAESSRIHKNRQIDALERIEQILADANQYSISLSANSMSIEEELLKLIVSRPDFSLKENAHLDPRAKKLALSFMQGILALDAGRFSGERRSTDIDRLFRDAKAGLVALS